MNLVKESVKKVVKRQYNWSIGIYLGESLFNFASPENISNPVLTAKDVTDVPAEFVADPFMVYENGIWFMFFEVMNLHDFQGDIGLATSNDGFNWTYQKIVLDEDFHLSYPYVFKWQNEYYMIPESGQINSIRLYKAVDFPTQWSLVKALISGKDYVDSSIFYFKGKWWLFTASTDSTVLHLYYTNELTGIWSEHPQSPIIKRNLNIARPGGRVIVCDEQKIIRYTQDNKYVYGNQVRAFEITKLTEIDYEEKEVKENPILKASGLGWNKTGMHHIDPHPIKSHKWIACVDGYPGKISVYGLEIHSDLGVLLIGFFTFFYDMIDRFLSTKFLEKKIN
jgi:hypothetical protein